MKVITFFYFFFSFFIKILENTERGRKKASEQLWAYVKTVKVGGKSGYISNFDGIPTINLVPSSRSVTGNVRSGKVRFRACSVPARPEIRAFLSLGMFVLSVVILGDFAE